MALVPVDSTLASWIGSGAGTTASTTTANEGYWIPKALVQAAVGADTAITNDIRDFLYSVLSRAAASYTQPIASGDTRPTKVAVTRTTDTISAQKKVVFTVVIDAATVVQTPDSITLPTYA